MDEIFTCWLLRSRHGYFGLFWLLVGFWAWFQSGSEESLPLTASTLSLVVLTVLWLMERFGPSHWHSLKFSARSATIRSIATFILGLGLIAHFISILGTEAL